MYWWLQRPRFCCNIGQHLLWCWSFKLDNFHWSSMSFCYRWKNHNIPIEFLSQKLEMNEKEMFISLHINHLCIYGVSRNIDSPYPLLSHKGFSGRHLFIIHAVLYSKCFSITVVISLGLHRPLSTMDCFLRLDWVLASTK